MHAALLSLIALSTLSGCALLEEQRTAPTDIVWTGYVYADLPADGVPFLEAGTFDIVDMDDQALATGTPSDATAGYWEVEVPVDVDVALRLDGLDQVATVWRSRTPSGRAYWLSGALFAVDATTQETFFASLDGWQGLSPAALSDGEIAHLWGTPYAPDRWAGAQVVVSDSDGAAQVALLAYDEDGALIDAGTGPVDLFVAPDLAPGPVTLTVTGADGTQASTTWPARAGDLLSAFYFALPAS